MSAAAIIVRPYAPEDFEDTVAVWRASKRAAFPYVEVQQRYTEEEDRAYFGGVLAVKNTIWVAEVESAVAGFLAIKDDFIDQLFVRVDLQRRGVGTALLQRAMELSPNGLRLFTFQRNLPARRFYEEFNFRPQRFGVSPPPESEPDVEYRWNGNGCKS